MYTVSKNKRHILFAGNYWINTGPSIVNKNLVNNLPPEILRLKSRNLIALMFECLWKMAKSRIVIFSSMSNFDYFRILLAKLFQNKIVYIMHGCLELEFKANKANNRIGLVNERLMLKNADKILCVSKQYRDLMSLQYPMYSNKMDVLSNGIDWQSYSKLTCRRERKRQIILIGGGRVTKRNLQVCKAVERINHNTAEIVNVIVYGNYMQCDDSDEIAAFSFVEFYDILPHDLFLEKLQESQLFIQNSDLESFSIGLIEAVACGCDILFSKNVGAREVFGEIQSEDQIENPLDINEIEEKIRYILEHSNNKRLLCSIDKKSTSIETAGQKLMVFAKSLL